MTSVTEGARPLRILLVVFFGLGCSGGESGSSPTVPEEPEADRTPRLVSIVSGNDQTGVVATSLSEPLVVQVKNRSGTPLEGVSVSFRVTSEGGGSVSPASATTGASGNASTRWTLGTVARELEVEARVASLSPLSLTATALPGPPTSVELSAEEIVLEAPGGTSTLEVAVTDEYGNDRDGDEVTWESMDPAVVSVDDAGNVEALAPGVTKVVASAGAASDEIEVVAVDRARQPIFGPPFEEAVPVSSLSDHEFKLGECLDDNEYVLTFWNERVPGCDGHRGYDWPMPVGTPLLAVAEGTVVFAGESDPFYCFVVDGMVTGLHAVVEHELPTGERIRSYYGHISSFDVVEGQAVERGQRIALSGNTGCSTGPHLHFHVERKNDRGQWAAADPYGWRGAEADPWTEHPDGVASIDLWHEGEAPELFRANRLVNESQWQMFISEARWLGIDDAVNPNNEFIEVTVDGRYSGPVLMTGYRIVNAAGETYTFPNGFVVQPDRPVRVHSGSGTDTDRELYWGRSSGVWDNWTDCAALRAPNGGQFFLSWGGGGCPQASPQPVNAVVRTPTIRGVVPTLPESPRD